MRRGAPRRPRRRRSPSSRIARRSATPMPASSHIIASSGNGLKRAMKACRQTRMVSGSANRSARRCGSLLQRRPDSAALVVKVRRIAVGCGLRPQLRPFLRGNGGKLPRRNGSASGRRKRRRAPSRARPAPRARDAWQGRVLAQERGHLAAEPARAALVGRVGGDIGARQIGEGGRQHRRAAARSRRPAPRRAGNIGVAVDTEQHLALLLGAVVDIAGSRHRRPGCRAGTLLDLLQALHPPLRAVAG